MRKKSTDELLSLLSGEGSLKQFLAANEEEFAAFSLCGELNALLEKYHMTKAAAIRMSNLDKIYAYQIFDGSRANPSRNKLLALCLAMGADLEETQKILCIGHSEKLYPRIVRDSVIIYAIRHKTSVMELNQLLYDMNMELLE